ncbi:MAG: B12-binding domain-containing radical SAM protein, partial [Candidatus Helarchaeota archaeon]
MRILLINPTTRRYTTNVSIQAQAPLGLLSLAAVLRSAGHNVKIFDRNVEDGSIKKYLKFEPELVGLTSFTGPMLLDAIYLSSIFRKHLDVPIVWGGIHASLLPKQTIENPNIDIVVVGEGEETILEVADCIEKRKDLEKVRGIYWKKRIN